MKTGIFPPRIEIKNPPANIMIKDADKVFSDSSIGRLPHNI